MPDTSGNFEDDRVLQDYSLHGLDTYQLWQWLHKRKCMLTEILIT